MPTHGTGSRYAGVPGRREPFHRPTAGARSRPLRSRRRTGRRNHPEMCCVRLLLGLWVAARRQPLRPPRHEACRTVARSRSGLSGQRRMATGNHHRGPQDGRANGRSLGRARTARPHLGRARTVRSDAAVRARHHRRRAAAAPAVPSRRPHATALEPVVLNVPPKPGSWRQRGRPATSRSVRRSAGIVLRATPANWWRPARPAAASTTADRPLPLPPRTNHGGNRQRDAAEITHSRAAGPGSQLAACSSHHAARTCLGPESTARRLPRQARQDPRAGCPGCVR
jgi:hypothetical protein